MDRESEGARERGRERERERESERERGAGRQGREAGEAEMRWMHEWDNIS